MSENKTYVKCSACGAEHDLTMRDCTSCGAPLNVLETDTAQKEEKWKVPTFMKNALLNNLLIFLLSVVLLALAFTPFAQLKLQKTEKSRNTLDVGVSPVEGIYLTAAGAVGMSDKELAKLDIYKDVKNMLDGKEKRDEQKIVDALFSLSLLSNKSDVRAGSVMFALFSIAYIILCLVLMVYSLIPLVRELIKKDGKSRTSRKAASVIWLIVLMMPILCFCCLQMCNVGESIVVNNMACADYSVSGDYGFFISLVLAVLGAVYVSIEPVILLLAKTHGTVSSKMKYGIVSVVLALMCIVSVFLPFGKIGFTMHKGNSKYEMELGYSVTDIGIQSAEDIDYYASVSRSRAEALLKDAPEKIYTNKKAYSEYADTVYLTTLVGAGRVDVTPINTAISLVSLSLLMLSGLFIYIKITGILFSREEKNIVKIAILNLLLSAALLVLGVVVVIITKTSLSGTVSNYIRYTVGAGPIIALVSGILLLKISNRKARERNIINYDEPDVSYAPYTVDSGNM